MNSDLKFIISNLESCLNCSNGISSCFRCKYYSGHKTESLNLFIPRHALKVAIESLEKTLSELNK